MKLFLKIIIVAAAIFAIAVGGAAIYLTRGLGSAEKLAAGSVDLSGIKDGLYTGVYDSGRFSNKVEVAVKDHKIINIRLINDVTFSKPEIASEVFDRVIKKQDVAVDAVSGATVTSKAYLKAIENALNGAGQ